MKTPIRAFGRRAWVTPHFIRQGMAIDFQDVVMMELMGCILANPFGRMEPPFTGQFRRLGSIALQDQSRECGFRPHSMAHRLGGPESVDAVDGEINMR